MRTNMLHLNDKSLGDNLSETHTPGQQTHQDNNNTKNSRVSTYQAGNNKQRIARTCQKDSENANKELSDLRCEFRKVTRLLKDVEDENVELKRSIERQRKETEKAQAYHHQPQPDVRSVLQAHF